MTANVCLTYSIPGGTVRVEVRTIDALAAVLYADLAQLVAAAERFVEAAVRRTES